MREKIKQAFDQVQAEDGLKHSTSAVSYTHLDVYKRQMHLWDLRIVRHTASGSLSESPGGVRPEYPASGRHYGRAVSSGSRIPVSYTHLK